MHVSEKNISDNMLSSKKGFQFRHQDRGAQWLSGRVLDWRPKGRGFEPHRRHFVVSLSKNINPSLVLVQPFITERLLMGRKESYQTKQTNNKTDFYFILLFHGIQTGFIIRFRYLTCLHMQYTQ